MPVDRDVVMSKVGLKRKHLRRRPAGRHRDRLDLDVAKAVIREAWMPSLFAPGQRIVKKHWIIRTRASAGLSDGAIWVQQLSGQHADMIAGAASDGDLRPSRRVLAHVVNAHTRPWLSDAKRNESFGDDDWRDQMSRQLPSRRTDLSVRPCYFERLPPVRVARKTGLIPPLPHPTGVEIFAAVNRREGDRPRCRPPARIAYHRGLGAVAVLDMHLQDQFWLSEGPYELGITPMDAGNVIHPVAQQHSKCVLAGMKLPRHIEGVVQDGLPVVRPAGVEYRVGDIGAVQVKFILSESGDNDDCALYQASDTEFFAEDGQWRHRLHPTALVFPRLRLKGTVRLGSDPVRNPLLRMQNRSRPLSRRAPIGGVSCLVPNSDFPEVGVVRGERLAAVSYVQTLAGLYSTRIPQAAAILRKFLRRGGDENLVAALSQIVRVPRRRAQLPAKPGVWRSTPTGSVMEDTCR